MDAKDTCLFEIPFRGNRDYLQGTDLFSEVTKWIRQTLRDPEAYLSSITFNRMCQHAALGVLGDSDENSRAFGSFTYESSQSPKTGHGYLVETIHPVKHREVYSEDLLQSSAELIFRGVESRLKVPEQYNAIQAIVGLTKMLCYHNSTGSGRWLFARLDLTGVLGQRIEMVELKLIRLIDERYAVVSVTADEKAIGKIRFIKDVG